MTDQTPEENIERTIDQYYELKALTSITAYELAQILQTMEIRVNKQIMRKLPPALHRHFVETSNDPCSNC